jgi:hypothetical protein
MFIRHDSALWDKQGFPNPSPARAKGAPTRKVGPMLCAACYGVLRASNYQIGIAVIGDCSHIIEMAYSTGLIDWITMIDGHLCLHDGANWWFGLL